MKHRFDRFGCGNRFWGVSCRNLAEITHNTLSWDVTDCHLVRQAFQKPQKRFHMGGVRSKVRAPSFRVGASPKSGLLGAPFPLRNHLFNAQDRRKRWCPAMEILWKPFRIIAETIICLDKPLRMPHWYVFCCFGWL